MPKKSLGKKLEAFGKKVGTQAGHRVEELAGVAKEAAKDIKHGVATLRLHSEREKSREITGTLENDSKKMEQMVTEVRTSAASSAAKMQDLEKRAQDIKNNQEIVALLQKLNDRDQAAGQQNLSIVSIEETYKAIIDANLLNKAKAACAEISNAPKTAAAGAGAGAASTAENKSDAEWQKIADKALTDLTTMQVTMSTALTKVSQDYKNFLAANVSLEQALKDIADKITIAASNEAKPTAEVKATSEAQATGDTKATAEAGYAAQLKALQEALAAQQEVIEQQQRLIDTQRRAHESILAIAAKSTSSQAGVGAGAGALPTQDASPSLGDRKGLNKQ